MSYYEFWYADEIGNRLSYINNIISFDYVKVDGDIGVLSLQTPQNTVIGNQPDKRIHIYRQPRNGRLSLDFTCYLRKFNTSTTLQGQTFHENTGFDLNSILVRRISAYYAGAAESSINGLVDDGMKQIFTDNFIDNADYSGTPSPARDIDSYGFSADSNLGDGPSLQKSFAWGNVLQILQSLQAESKANGNEVFFGLVAGGETSAQFRTFTGQPGSDRSISSANPMIFSMEYGNLSSPSLEYDYENQATFVYAGGQGQEDERNIQTASDSAGLELSQLNRVETFAWSQGKTNATVQADADNELSRRRSRINFSGTLLNTPMTPYGGLNGWNIGDKVTVVYSGIQFDAIIRAVRVRVDSSGKEFIQARVESE